MPPDAAKKARMWEMKWHSLSVRQFQSVASAEKSISLAVQNEASAYVHLPDVIVLDGEKDNTVGFCSEKWFGGKESFLFGSLVLQ